MASLHFHLPLQHSLLLWVSLSLALLHLASSVRVRVHNTSLPLNGHQLPDELNITLEGESGLFTYLHLTRVKHFVPNVPVFTLTMDQSGRYHEHQEQMDNTQVIGYYQDIKNEAAIELFVTEGGHAHNGSSFVLTGELSIKGERYTLNPNDSRVKRDTASRAAPEDVPYVLVAQPTSAVALHDYIEAPPEDTSHIEASQPDLAGPRPLTDTTSAPRRERRQSKQDIFIDVVALVDHAVYARFLATSKTRAATLQAVREYYAFIFNGVDMRYQGIASPRYNIRVRLVKVIIAETAAASQFTEKFRVQSSPRDRVDANDALYELSSFADGSGRAIVFPCDHVMLFTGYDLTSKSPSGSVSEFTTGLAFTNTLCRADGKSASIVEDLGGFQCVETATHELGHSLSSPHDGDGNACSSADRFIMSSGGLQATESNKYNPWLFSSCSVTYITNFIGNKLATTAGRTCLTQQLPVASGVTDVGDRLPGQEFSADDQCRMIYGSGSRMCRGQEFGAASEICSSMFCFDPSTTGTCYKQKASMGTTCGSGKLCLNGKCVPDSRAPVMDENCVFGDQPGEAFEDKTCPQFVDDFSGYCYQAVVKSRCCASCQKFYRNVSGCEYGDTARGCTRNACRYGTANTLKQCCRTCNYGGASASTESKILRLTNQTRLETDVAVTQRRTTPDTIATTVSSPECMDHPNARVASGNCANLRWLKFLCTLKTVQNTCCLTCRRLNSGL